jgi:hypothetical protein
MKRGIVVALLHCLLVLSIAGKYALDRERLPRAWVKTAPVDPNLPVRGRYVSLRLQVEGLTAGTWIYNVRLGVHDGRLVGTLSDANTGVVATGAPGQPCILQEPVAFFIPEHVPDPSRRAAGEELWVEVSVPKKGMPRPLRLGVKNGGVLTPLPQR